MKHSHKLPAINEDGYVVLPAALKAALRTLGFDPDECFGESGGMFGHFEFIEVCDGEGISIGHWNFRADRWIELYV